MAARIASLVLTLAALPRAGLAGPPVTFHRHIAPILFERCAPCHRPGESGPFSLLSYDDARKHARDIGTVTSRRYMPPWLPEPGYGDFADELRLSDDQIRLIEEWVRAGAPEGARSDALRPPVFTPGWQLGPPDLVIPAPKPFLAPAGGPDVFWNFVLSPSIRETRYVKAIEIRPGSTRVAHHANLLIDRARSARRQEKSRDEGFAGMDLTIESDTFDPDSHFLFWKPGSMPWLEPVGMAWHLDPEDDLVLNIHLRPSGKPELVQPSVGLYFTKEAQTRYPILLQLEYDGAIDIPPGARDFVVADDFRLPLDIDVLGVYPHAHYLGKRLEAFATLPDGSRRWLIRIPDWDLSWQAVYRYRAPLFLPKGTVVSMRFHYDNSDANTRNPSHPPKRVVGGNQATDEMGHLWLQALPRGVGDQRMALHEAAMRHRLEKYPADFSAHFNLGALLLSRKEAASAIGYLRDALRVQPEQPAALNTLGVALESEGRHDEAIEQFRRALHVRPDFTDALYNLAHALTELGDLAASQGRLGAAVDSYRELVALEPANADLHSNLGILLARLGDLRSAIKQFEAALRIDPSHEAARRNLEIARKKLRQN